MALSKFNSYSSPSDVKPFNGLIKKNITIAQTNEIIMNDNMMLKSPIFSTSFMISPLIVEAMKEAIVQIPINNDTYFLGANLLTNEFPSGEKQISPQVINKPNRQIHKKCAFPAPLTSP